MLNIPQLQRMFTKLHRLERTYTPYLFPVVKELSCSVFETEKECFSVPQGPYRPIQPGNTWGTLKGFGWFQMTVQSDERLAGQAL